MHWAGDGSNLWRVRVDLFAADASGARVTAAHQALKRQLISDDEPMKQGEYVADQGLGVEGRPVVGLLFWAMTSLTHLTAA